jgi:hypothetical protein
MDVAFGPSPASFIDAHKSISSTVFVYQLRLNGLIHRANDHSRKGSS